MAGFFLVASTGYFNYDFVMKKRLQEFHVIIERDEDGFFVGDVPELPGCHTQAKSLDQLMKRMHEAIRLYLEAHRGRSPSEFVGVQRIAL